MVFECAAKSPLLAQPAFDHRVSLAGRRQFLRGTLMNERARAFGILEPAFEPGPNDCRLGHGRRQFRVAACQLLGRRRLRGLTRAGLVKRRFELEELLLKAGADPVGACQGRVALGLVLEDTLPIFSRQNLEVRFECGGQGVEMLRRDGGHRRRDAKVADLLQEGIERGILPAGLGEHRLRIAVVANPADCGLRARDPTQPDVRRYPRQRPCGDLGGAAFLCNIENFHAIGPAEHSPISYRSRLLSCALGKGLFRHSL